MKNTSLDKESDPPSPTIQFIRRIENANPNDPGIEEDDTNASWGHSQFTAGGITCRSVLKTWSDIANVTTAYRLLAASLKTCLVARHLCFTNNIPEQSLYLSDIYLEQVVDILWNIVSVDTEAVSPMFFGQYYTGIYHLISLKLQETIVESVRSACEQSPPSDVPKSTPATGPGLDTRLERLYADELKDWMLEHSIPLPPHNKRKKNGM